MPWQLSGKSPFSGTLVVERLPVFTMARLTARKLRTPLDILDYAFRGENDLKYLDVPGFPPILFVRDPEIIKSVTLATANQGDFDRDTLQTQGIARVLGGSNLLFSQGDIWKRHRMAAARVFGATNFQNPEIYSHMEQTIRRAVEPQIEQLANQVRQSPTGTVEMRLESGIQAMMLNVLVNVMFGSQVPFDELRDRYLPAIASVIRYIMVDTVVNQARFPVLRLPSFSRRHAHVKQQRLIFEELVERVIQTRSEGAGFWPLMTAEGPEDAIRSNVRVFLAGALEATTSYIGWALSNLARNNQARARAQAEADNAEISPVGREKSTYLQKVLAET
ncbi:MAG: cytochrome P450, partial [bacterium]